MSVWIQQLHCKTNGFLCCQTWNYCSVLFYDTCIQKIRAYLIPHTVYM